MRIHAHKKGVSPLIATVLLIVFAIAIASILLSWLGSYTTETTERAQVSSDTAVACAQQAVDIVRVFTTTVNGTPYVARVDVQSTGQDPVIVKDLLVSTTGLSAPCDFANDTTQNPGNITTYIASNATACGVTCSNVDTIRVVTACGGVTSVVTGSSTIVGC